MPSKMLEEIYQTRNRLANHEPVLHKRYQDTMASIQFVVENLGMSSATPDSPLAKLISQDVEDVTLKAKALHERLDSYRIQGV